MRGSVENLVGDNEQRVFYVWVDLNDQLTRQQVEGAGCLVSIPPEVGSQRLLFLPNPEFRSALSPFQNNILRNYTAEYNLEIAREKSFPRYPSRLQAVFLFASGSDAASYHALHPEHVGGRVLKAVRTVGPYIFSTHDGSWVDFLRLPHSVDTRSLEVISEAYWMGRKVLGSRLASWNSPWQQEPIAEVLFAGRVDFLPGSRAG